MNQNQQPRPNRTQISREEYLRRKKLREKRRRMKRIRAIILLLLIVVLLIVIISCIVKSCKGYETETQETKEIQTTQNEITDTADPTDTRKQTDNTSDGGNEPQPQAPTFTADLSAYEKYMEPEDRDAYLILVNPDHPLGENDVPADLVDVVNTRKDGRDTQKMREYAEKALEALYLEAEAEGVLTQNTKTGYTLSVTSAYRSYNTQYYTFNSYVTSEMKNNPSLSREQAEAIVMAYSCKEGTSEHQTGLCCDMHDLSGADISFANSDIYPWLRENAWKFGFILRFPEDKVDVTKISYEPWHYRYVGRYHAQKIHESGMCLEEYVAKLNG